MKVYVVIHDFYSHDMFVIDRGGNPQVFGVFSTRAKANKHIRPNMDDYVKEFTIDDTGRKSKRTSR